MCIIIIVIILVRNCFLLGLEYSSEQNISLEEQASFYAYTYDVFSCENATFQVKILRTDEQIETYELNGTFYDLEYLDRGLSISGHCNHPCYIFIDISPANLRYNGATITAVLNVSECSISNATGPMLLNIQGIIYLE